MSFSKNVRNEAKYYGFEHKTSLEKCQREKRYFSFCFFCGQACHLTGLLKGQECPNHELRAYFPLNNEKRECSREFHKSPLYIHY